MTNIELQAYTAVAHNLQDIGKIAKQLEIANKLKALELKANHPELISSVDSIIED